jgi:hypothetical protein
MTDVPAPQGASASTPPTLSESFPGEERRAALAPKLAALLTQFRQLEELEHPDVEPAPPMPERWDGDERR